MRELRLVMVVLAWGALLVCAQAEKGDEAQDMVRRGMAEALEARWAGGRSAEEKHLLARAYANQARRARAGEARDKAFEAADAHYRAWIELLERDARRTDPADVVALGAARVEYAGMILSGQAAEPLDQYEITNGLKADEPRLAELLTRAGKQYQEAEKTLKPIVDDLPYYEEDLLAAGMYDAFQQTRLDLKFNLGWVGYYLGVLAEDPSRARQLLEAAERRFQELIDSGQTGQMRYQCYMALGMTRWRQGEFDEAERMFGYALGPDVSPVTAVQVRYQLARAQLAAEKFDEARTTLGPVVVRDPQNLPAGYGPARFYVNLAHIWHAYSYLLEAVDLMKVARESTARTAIETKAQRRRELGLAEFKRLSERGGPWPGLVQLYVASTVSVHTPLDELSPMELHFTAGVLLDAQRYDEALRRLEAARARLEAQTSADKRVLADVLFELGRAHYLLKDERKAAAVFQNLAEEYAASDNAPQAVTFAYTLWGRVAERSQQVEDYLRLADTLRTLIARYAEHPKRAEARWLLPVALQLAGRYAQAAEAFAEVPRDGPHGEAAAFRELVCRRLALDARRSEMTDVAYAEAARRLARALARYAPLAYERAQAMTPAKKGEALEWSAEARVMAAELLVSPKVAGYRPALDVLESYEEQYPESGRLATVLAARIRAYRGLREFEQASKVLRAFLERATPAQRGVTLLALAQGMQEEVERLVEKGEGQQARRLAQDSVETFDELEKWLRAGEQRTRSLTFVRLGRAQMLHLAGQHDAALEIVNKLLAEEPNNGNYRYLQAQILTERLGDDGSKQEIQLVQEAWAALLADPAIRQRAPERYWEARYRWLEMGWRRRDARAVSTASQLRVLDRGSGVEPWVSRLDALLAEARRELGLEPLPASEADQPTSETLPTGG